MSLSMYQASVPVFVQILGSLGNVLEKAEAHAAARKIDPAVLAAARLYPDMLPLARQLHIACDFAKSATARLAGLEVPTWSDDEKTLAEFRARIAKTSQYVQGFKPAQIDGSEDREIVLKMRDATRTFKGQAYLLHFVLPNFYFHATTAYDILRHNGVELGKRDFLGQVPGMNA
jgi:uncharacterized protein